jgi:hypothetical protein
VRVVVISDGLRWVGEIGEVTEGMNLFGFFFNGFFFVEMEDEEMIIL